MQEQRVIQQGLGRGVVEALPGPRRRVPQRARGQREIAAQAGVVGHHHRVGVRPPGQDPAGLPVQQRGPAGRGAGRQGLPQQLVPEPEGPALVGQELPGDGPLGVVQQFHRAAAQHRRQQVDVQLGADHRRGPQQRPGRAQLVAARGHRLDERRGQRPARPPAGPAR